MIATLPRILIKSVCGHGDIDPEEHAYIESKATGEAYCDLICLCEVEDIEYTSERREWIKREWEVVMHG